MRRCDFLSEASFVKDDDPDCTKKNFIIKNANWKKYENFKSNKQIQKRKNSNISKNKMTDFEQKY